MAENPNRGQWTRRPSEADMATGPQLLRVPSKGVSGLIVLSHDLLGCMTHYHRGRSVPCVGKACLACEEKAESRWRGWLSAWAIKLDRRIILELTPVAASKIDEWFREHRTLRGASIAIQRIPAKPNGKMAVDLRNSDMPIANLPAADDVQKEMERMWGRNLERLSRQHKQAKLKVIGEPDENQEAASA